MEVSYLRPIETSEAERTDVELFRAVGRVMAALPADGREAMKVLELAREWLADFVRRP